MKELDINMSLVQDNGTLLGEMQPTKDSKGSWSELFYYNGKLISILYADTQDCWSVCAYEVEEEEINNNVDDPEKAKSILANKRNQ